MDMLDQKAVIDNDKLSEIKGGFSLSASFLSAIFKGIEVIYEIGQGLGTSFRRTNENKICPID